MDKPFKTIEEQLEILRSRNVEVDGSSAQILRREGYYSVVNGYKALFLNPDAEEERYADGTSLEDIYRLFVFDRDLRMTMMRYFAQAEATLKTVCAYRFSELHQREPEPYLDPKSYRQERAYQRRVTDLVDDFKKILHKPPYDKGAFKRDYIEHYVRNHGETPLWVLTNYLMLGQIFKFYEYQNESTRNYIAMGFAELYNESYGASIKISQRKLRIAYDHIKDFRNICAHDERLFCARVSPSKDISLAHLLSDMSLVLSKEEHARMQGSVINLLHALMTDLGGEKYARVIRSMGFDSLDEMFFRTGK